MANSTSTGACAPDKSNPLSFPTAVPLGISGVVRHPLITASVQVQILSVVDEAGSATLGDIIAELPDHDDPVGAVIALVEDGALTLAVDRHLDAHAVVRRAVALGHGSGLEMPLSGVPCEPSDPAPAPALPRGLITVPISSGEPIVIVGSGESRRAFGRVPSLSTAGVYAMIGDEQVYIGYGSNLGSRIAYGNQPIGRVETIVAITDSGNGLSGSDGLVAERILWTRLDAAHLSLRMINDVPTAARVTPERYIEIDALIARSALALRREGILFLEGSIRSVLAGPRAEPDRVGPARHRDEVPEGELLELGFGDGLVARAARQDDRWLLLAGSEVRVETAVTAGATASYLRAAWLHTGLLVRSASGAAYTLTHDMVFPTGSAVALFVTGSKGRTLDAWKSTTPCDDGPPPPA